MKFKIIFFSLIVFSCSPTLNSLDSKKINNIQPEIITKCQLKAISSQKTPNGTLAVFNIADKSIQDSSFYIVLDNISDPGNLGTILRTMDGVGATNCILLNECTDPFSYEAVRASMGALFSVKIIASTNQKSYLLTD